jgi:hypothetical protein
MYDWLIINYDFHSSQRLKQFWKFWYDHNVFVFVFVMHIVNENFAQYSNACKLISQIRTLFKGFKWKIKNETKFKRIHKE